MKPATWAGLLGAANLAAATAFAQSYPGLAPISVARITAANPVITAYPLTGPPVSGFIPRVVFGLTDEQTNDDLDWSSYIGAPGFNTTLPSAESPKYLMATYDTGSQSHILTVASADAFGIAAHNLEGQFEQTLIGANGTEFGIATDPMGIYATGFQGVASTAGGNITVQPGSLRGHFNSSLIVLEDPNSGLPNVIGTPMTALYQTVIQNSVTRHLTVGAQTFKSPQVTFQSQGTTIPANYSRLSLSAVPVGGFIDPPSFLNFNSLDHEDPTTATFWGSLLANVTVSNRLSNPSGSFSSTGSFLFDTGAEISVISEDMANNLDIFLSGDDKDTPDFEVDVTGVGGTVIKKPGFFIDQLRFNTTGGALTYTNVPVVVIDLPDPRDPVNEILPGLLGTNLFTDRDLIIDTSTNPKGVWLSPLLTPQWNVDANGNWSDDTKWMLGSPQEADAPANFLSSITAPRTINVDGAFTAGSLKFDNANRYTLSGAGQITLEKFVGTTTIDVVNGSHTIDVPVQLHNNAIVTITPPASVLTMSGGLSGAGRSLTKAGAGVLEMKNIRVGPLNVSAGTVRNTVKAQANHPDGTNVVTALSITAGAQLDLTNNSMVIDYSGPVGTLVGDVRGMLLSNRLTTSSATATRRLGYGDNAVLSKTTFAGQTVDPSSLLIKFTYAGDADLDGDVDVGDLGALATAWQTAGPWTAGDFDYTGTIDVNDLGMLATNWQAGVGSPLGPQSLSDALSSLGLPSVSVPEPGVMAALSFAFLAASRRSGRVRRF
jgi:hypothetical protein